MKTPIYFQTMFAAAPAKPKEQAAVFALLNLGVLSSLSSGMMTASEAVQWFYHVENCQFVRRRLRDKTADEIMSHGVQLSDLFDVLSPEEAQREFQHELEVLRSLSLKILERKRIAA